MFWAKYYSHYSCLGYLVDFLMFTQFLATDSARMTNLEEAKYSLASQNVPKPSLHLELWGRGLLMSPGVWGWLAGRGSWGHPGLIQPIPPKHLGKKKHPHILIYMRGLKSEDLVVLDDFLFFGEATF